MLLNTDHILHGSHRGNHVLEFPTDLELLGNLLIATDAIKVLIYTGLRPMHAVLD
jgi:hypothetical protein